MDDFDTDAGSLRATLEAMQGEAAGAQGVVSDFTRELGSLRGELLYTDKEVKGLSRSLGQGLRKAFDGVIFDGMKFSDALSQIGQSFLSSAYSAAVKPVQNAVGGAVTSGINSLFSGVGFFEKGGAFSQGRVMPFATGGIVSGPTVVPMRGGKGIMGEAGPEAIMPLTRGSDGRLGVQTLGGCGRAATVVMNISTPDVQGFRRSQSQIASEMSRALGRGQRNQ